MRIAIAAAALGLLLTPTIVQSQERLLLGGDTYAAGSSVTLSEPAGRDVAASGGSVDLTGRTAGDAMVGGMDVNVEAPVGRDLYAAGFSVSVAQPVGEDLTAAGFNIRVRPEVVVGGNARLLGGNVSVDGQVVGSLLAAGGTVTIGSVIGGDVRVSAGTLSFGPEARINGTLTYTAAKPIEIAPSVIPADRVHFVKREASSPSEMVDNAIGKPLRGFWPSFLSISFGFVVAVAFLTLLAAVLFALMPVTVEGLRRETESAPFRAIGIGVLALATLVGLIPVSAMSIIGIPLIPVVILTIVAAWIVGYLLGVYVLAWRIAQGFREMTPTNGNRVVVVALGLAAAAILNFVPVLGWLFNLALLLAGMGGIAARIMARLSRPAAPVAAEPALV